MHADGTRVYGCTQALVEGHRAPIGGSDAPRERLAAHLASVLQGSIHQSAANAAPTGNRRYTEVDDRSCATAQVWIVGGMVEQISGNEAIEFGNNDTERRAGTEAISDDLGFAESGAERAAGATQHLAKLR